MTGNTRSNNSSITGVQECFAIWQEKSSTHTPVSGMRSLSTLFTGDQSLPYSVELSDVESQVIFVC